MKKVDFQKGIINIHPHLLPASRIPDDYSFVFVYFRWNARNNIALRVGHIFSRIHKDYFMDV